MAFCSNTAPEIIRLAMLKQEQELLYYQSQVANGLWNIASNSPLNQTNIAPSELKPDQNLLLLTDEGE